MISWPNVFQCKSLLNINCHSESGVEMANTTQHSQTLSWQKQKRMPVKLNHVLSDRAWLVMLATMHSKWSQRGWAGRQFYSSSDSESLESVGGGGGPPGAPADCSISARPRYRCSHSSTICWTRCGERVSCCLATSRPDCVLQQSSHSCNRLSSWPIYNSDQDQDDGLA